MIIGILIARRQIIPAVLWAVLLAGLIIFSGILFFIGRSKPDVPSGQRALFVVLGLGFACVGALRYELVYNYYAEDHIVFYCREKPRLASLRGVIVSEPYITKNKSVFADYLPSNPVKTIFNLRCESVKCWKGWHKAVGLIHVVVKEPLFGLRMGSKVQIEGWISLRPVSDNPGQKDPQDYYRAARNLVACNVDTTEGITLQTVAADNSTWFYRLRYKMQSLAYAAVTEDLYLSWREGENDFHNKNWYEASLPEKNRGFLAALLLGQRYRLDKPTQELFLQTGTMQFLSVSGLHVGLMAGFIWWLVRLAGLSRWWQGLVTLTAVVGFVLLVPTQAPIVRAGIICMVFCLAYMTRRRTNGLNLLAFAALIQLLWQPLELFWAGFQLSYIVVLGMLLFVGPILRHQWRPPSDDLAESLSSSWRQQQSTQALLWRQWLLRRLVSIILNVTVVSLVAWIVGIPLAAYHFNRIAPWTMLGSILLFPLISLTMFIGFAKLLLAALLPSLVWPLTSPLEAMASLNIFTGRLLTALPFSNINTASPSVWFIMVFYALLGVAAWSIHKGRGLGRPIISGLLLWMVAFIWLVPFHKPPDGIRMEVLSVGQGAAVIIHLPDDKVICYDAGSMGAFDVSGYTVEPFLRSRGVQRLDAIFISHPNLDHYSGVPELCQNFKVAAVYISEYYDQVGSALSKILLDRLDELNIPVYRISRGSRLENSLPDAGKKYRIEMLWPPPPKDSCELNSNDSSLVLKITNENGSILLPGDIGPLAQQLLLELDDPRALAANVLLLPHHGAITETLPAFIEAINPQICVGSCSKIRDNNFAQMDQILPGRKLLPTYKYGAVSIALTPAGAVIKTFHEAKIVDE